MADLGIIHLSSENSKKWVVFCRGNKRRQPSIDLRRPTHGTRAFFPPTSPPKERNYFALLNYAPYVSLEISRSDWGISEWEQKREKRNSGVICKEMDRLTGPGGRSLDVIFLAIENGRNAVRSTAILVVQVSDGTRLFSSRHFFTRR